MIIEAKDIKKEYNGVSVLNGVNFSAERGEFISITGASGSGKSTFLSILGGIDRPTSGQVLLDGDDITKKKEKELAILRRSKISFVFQFFNLAPYLTLKENIYLPVTLAGKKAADFSSRGDKLVSYLGLESFLNKLPSELSGGEQQRAAIARGLIFSPEIIFLDEPTGNLDSKNAENITQLLRNINVEFNTTVIQVTHNNQLAALSDRVLVMQDGLLL